MRMDSAGAVIRNMTCLSGLLWRTILEPGLRAAIAGEHGRDRPARARGKAAARRQIRFASTMGRAVVRATCTALRRQVLLVPVSGASTPAVTSFSTYSGTAGSQPNAPSA
jgi:hypothetical protein